MQCKVQRCKVPKMALLIGLPAQNKEFSYLLDTDYCGCIVDHKPHCEKTGFLHMRKQLRS